MLMSMLSDISQSLSKARHYLLGIFLCVIVACGADYISSLYSLPVFLIALLTGLLLHPVFRMPAFSEGVKFSAVNVLRFGVVLIGARLAFSDVLSLGWSVVGIVIASTLFVILMSVVFARILGVDRDIGIITGAATAICGASAALAISSLLPQTKDREKHTLIAVVGVTVMGTVLMISYPFVVPYLRLEDFAASLMVGGTIHDVSQVVGAGYSISTEVGDTAILIKLIRVFMLVPVIFLFIWLFKKEEKGSQSKPFPLFILGFLVLVVMNSFQLLPDAVVEFFEVTSRWMLVIAMVGVGMKTSFKSLFSLGWKPLFLVFTNTVVISLIYISFLSL